MERVLKFKIFRYNPADPSSKPRMQEYKVEETPNMTLFIALNKIREEIDSSLNFEFCCRAAICGACAMVINGKPGLACKTKIQDLPDEITLLPLPIFKLVSDLVIDTGVWFREMYQKTESWIHTEKEFDPSAEEERMDNKLANEIYDLDKCIECGCCVAACGSANLRPDFLGATALVRIARFEADPRDHRTDNDFYELVGTDQGVFGCMGIMACDDVCPKELPLFEALGYIRRKMGITAIKRVLKKA